MSGRRDGSVWSEVWFSGYAADEGAQAVEASVDILVTSVYLFDIVYRACAFG